MASWRHLARRVAVATARRSATAHPGMPSSRSRAVHTTLRARDTLPVPLPALSPTMTEGIIVEWLAEEGAKVDTGDVLFEMETDKAVIAVTSTEDGYLAKILEPAGKTPLRLGHIVALMVDDEGEAPDTSIVDALNAEAASASSASAAPAEAAPQPAAAAPPPAAAPAPTPGTAAPAGAATTLPLSPAVRFLVDTNSLDITQIFASGPRGRLLKGDVLAFLGGEQTAAPAATPAPAAKAPANKGPASAQPQSGGPRQERELETPFTDVPASNMRKTIANRLTECKSTIPHTYVTMQVDVTELMQTRKAMIAELGTKFSLNDMLLKAAASALRQVPEVNGTWTEDGVALNSSVDVCVAVATETGLFTPILKGTDALSVLQISSLAKEMVDKANNKKLAPEDYQGGTFTVSNLGMFGISEFTAIINPPQSCILAVGTAKPLLLERDDGTTGFGQSMSFALCCDARVVDNATAARWLHKFASLVQNPTTLVDATDGYPDFD